MDSVPRKETMGDGDGWIRCARGHRHWGRYGAAGLLLRDGTGRWVLQHRAEWTHEGGTWGIPGGARDSHESAIATALREAHEEAAIEPGSVRPTGLMIDDHGGWSYTTVVADVAGPVYPRAANAESNEIIWCSREQIQSLPLHSGFSTTWPRLRDCGPGLVLVVDVAAWLQGQSRDGSHGHIDPPAPDQADLDQVWERLLDLLDQLHLSGVATHDLPESGLDTSPLSRHFPQLVLLSTDKHAGSRLADRAAARAVPVSVCDALISTQTHSDQAGAERHILRPDPQWLNQIHIQHTATSR